MRMNAVFCGLLVLAANSSPVLAEDAPIPNPNIDMPGHLEAVKEAATLRETHRVSEADFLRMMSEPGTVLLDARSRARFAELHIEGAVNLPFTDFSETSLAAVIPAKATRVLIYCNNNFLGAEAFFTKSAPAALNLSTFSNLYIYGYRNVYELGPLIGVQKTILPLAGSQVPKRN